MYSFTPSRCGLSTCIKALIDWLIYWVNHFFSLTVWKLVSKCIDAANKLTKKKKNVYSRTAFTAQLRLSSLVEFDQNRLGAFLRRSTKFGYRDKLGATANNLRQPLWRGRLMTLVPGHLQHKPPSTSTPTTTAQLVLYLVYRPVCKMVLTEFLSGIKFVGP